jgi:minor histocompatibility antigen H13
MAYRGSVVSGVAVLVSVAAMSVWEVISYPLATVVTAGACVLIGSARSEQLSMLVRGEEEEAECIEKKEAVKLPLLASGCVMGCYLLVRSSWSAWVQKATLGYFVLLGVCGLKFYFESALGPLLRVCCKSQYRTTWKPPFATKPIHIVFTWADACAYLPALLLGLLYCFTKHWLLNNLLALILSIHAIESTSVGSFSTGAVLLVSLCVYDVFWVFATDVMPTLVRELDVPIKLLFPKVQGDIWTADYSLLGLGDVIIPGLVVALAYRLDYFLACKKERKGVPKYFLAGLVGYLIGLYGSFLVMWTSKYPQPAILYISPCITVCLILTAISSGEVKAMQSYKED